MQEKSARHEKAAALEQLFRSRLSVLIGPAGTGKTTLLRMLCSLPGLAEKGLLLLAPTGKARVRLEEQTEHAGYWPDAGAVSDPAAAVRRERPAPTFPSPGRLVVATIGP